LELKQTLRISISFGFRRKLEQFDRVLGALDRGVANGNDFEFRTWTLKIGKVSSCGLRELGLVLSLEM
jgi:hypothetical protein